MDKNKVFLVVQSVVCVLVGVLLIVGVIGIFLDGQAAHAENPLTWVFTREIVGERFRPIAPLFFAAIGLTAGGMLLGAKDGNADKPVKGGKVENRAPGGKTLRTVLLLVAVALLVLGVFNGSARDVFGKAVKICTECVGLG